MAQNINIVQYVHIQNPGAQQARQGQTYQLPPNSLGGVISAKRQNPEAGKRKIKTHKAFIGITDNAAGEGLYGDWRDTVKDQMLAMNYADIHKFPDVEFQQIVAGMRRLLPVCNVLATVSAANNIYLIQEIDEGVIQLVNDYGKKLTNTIGKRVPGAPPPGNPGVLPAQVIVRGTILPPGAPGQWGPAMAGLKAGLVPQNAPPVNNPQPGPANSVNAPVQSRPIPQTNVPGTSRRITLSAAKAQAAHPTNTCSTPAQTTSSAGNCPTQSKPADLMNLFRILAQIAQGALPQNSLAQSRSAHPKSTHSTPSMTSLFGTSPPENNLTESRFAHPTNTPSTTGTLPLFLPTPPGNSSTESGSAHPTNAPSTTSTPLLFTHSPPGNSPTQSGAAHITNAASTTSTQPLFTPSPQGIALRNPYVVTQPMTLVRPDVPTQRITLVRQH